VILALLTAACIFIIAGRIKAASCGCRLLAYRLPSRSPWLNAIKPKWVHSKRALVEPIRTLARAELKQRLCAY
jgi:hypothetical protein